MTDSEFYENFMQDIYARAGAEKNFGEEVFTEVLCEFLVEQAVIETYDLAFYKKTQQGIRVDAWAFNKDKQTLSLFISDFNASPDIETLAQADVSKLFKRVEKFFQKSTTAKFYRDLEEALPIFGVVNDILENQKYISKLKCFFINK